MSAHRGKAVSHAEFARMWFSPMTQAEIGAVLGITDLAVNHRANRRGLPPRKKGPGPALVDGPELREMWAANVLTSAIAEHFCVSERTIRNVATRFGYPRRTGLGRASISMAEFRQLRAGQRMAAVAAAEQRATDRMWNRAS